MVDDKNIKETNEINETNETNNETNETNNETNETNNEINIKENEEKIEIGDDDAYKLHKFVFLGNLEKTESILKNAKQEDLDKIDNRGNTPLHIAIFNNNTDMLQLLLKYRPTINIGNVFGWTPLEEAISMNNRKNIKLLWEYSKAESKIALRDKLPTIVANLDALDDFYLEMKWNFSSWIPFFLSDVGDEYKIWKRGTSLRVDTTVVGIEGIKFIRGDCSLYCYIEKNKEYWNNDKKTNKQEEDIQSHTSQFYVVDNKTKKYKKIEQKEYTSEQQESFIEEELNYVMSVPLTRSKTTEVAFERAQQGVWGWRTDKSEKIGEYNCDVFNVTNMNIITTKRVEHLTEEERKELKKFSAMMNNSDMVHQAVTEQEQKEGEETTEPKETDEKKELPKIVPRKSLDAPKRQFTFKEYFAKSTESVHIGREKVATTSQRTLKPTIAMSDEFPMDKDTVVYLLELISQNLPHASKAKDFIQQKLPPGFPVRIKLPIIGGGIITATITFGNFSSDKIPEEKLQIPKDYKPSDDVFPSMLG